MSAVFVLSSCNHPNSSTNSDSSTSLFSSIDIDSSSEKEDSSSRSDSTIEIINEENVNAKEVNISTLTSKKSSDSSNLYRITGYAQYPKNTTYGNFDLIDKTGYIFVYGCSKNKSTISGSYTYSNDKSYKSLKINAGDEITMEGLYVYYSYSSGYGVSEFQGYVTKIKRNNYQPIKTMAYTASETYSGSYYKDVENLTGSALLTGLHNLMDTTHKTYISYNSLKSHFAKSDDNIDIYTGQKVSNLNREHIWPKSLSNDVFEEEYAGSDLHHLRPSDSKINSMRSNASFAPLLAPNDYGYRTIDYVSGNVSKLSSNTFEPADDIKGDIARIIAYVYVHYSSEIGGNSKSYYGALKLYYVLGPYESEAKRLLRMWNVLDPVDEKEMKRNEYAYQVQGNRNPFIDHPSYLDKIFP